jgi:hypothetical protein
MERRRLVQKQIVTGSYWLGLLCALIALVLRALSIFGILPITVVQHGKTAWCMMLYRGALMFFLMAIATASYAWVRGEKT